MEDLGDLQTALQDLMRQLGLSTKKTMLEQDLKMKIEQVELLNTQITTMKEELSSINVELGLEDTTISSDYSNTIIL